MKKLLLIPVIAVLLSACHKDENLNVTPVSPTILDPREAFQTLPALPPFPQGTNFGVFYDTTFNVPNNNLWVNIYLTYGGLNIMEVTWPKYELKPGLGDLVWLSLEIGPDLVFYKNQSLVVGTIDRTVLDIRIKDEIVYLCEYNAFTKDTVYGYYSHASGVLVFP